MLKPTLMTIGGFAATTATAFAHPGHSDQSIHFTVWVVSAIALVGLGLLVTGKRRKSAQARSDTKRAV